MAATAVSKQTWMEIINQPQISKAVNPRRWGSNGWGFLDCVIMSYPLVPNADEQEKMANFFHSLKYVLPCMSCRVDFISMLEQDPVEQHLHSREALARYVHKLHNQVNAKLGKPLYRWEDFVQRFGKSPPIDVVSTTPVPFAAPSKTFSMPVKAAQVNALAPKEKDTTTTTLIVLLFLVAAGIGAAVLYNKFRT